MTERPDERTTRLFVYGSLLAGEPDHDLLSGARSLGPARTSATYVLVELTGFPALVPGGRLQVVGELYLVDAATLRRIDVKKEHPVLFRREPIELEDGGAAEAYVMSASQVRARRRLKVGDWRERFRPAATGIPESPWREFARSRRPKR